MISLDSIESLAFDLWIIVVLILLVGLIASIFLYKKAKNSYAIGLIALTICFIIGRIFAIPVRFYLGQPAPTFFSLDAILMLNLAFWIIVGLIYLLGGISLFKEKIKGKNFLAYWVSLVAILVLVFYVARTVINSSIGAVPNIMAFEGLALLFEIAFLIFSWVGFLILIYCVARNYDSKTRYVFTFLTCITLLFHGYRCLDRGCYTYLSHPFHGINGWHGIDIYSNGCFWHRDNSANLARTLLWPSVTSIMLCIRCSVWRNNLSIFTKRYCIDYSSNYAHFRVNFVLSRRISDDKN